MSTSLRFLSRHARLSPTPSRLAGLAVAMVIALLLTPTHIARGQGGTGSVDRFTWNSIPSPQRKGTAFPVQIFARDSLGSVVSNFNGNASLSAVAGTRVTRLFEDGFESSDFTSNGWQRVSDAGAWSVVTNTAAVGRSSVSLAGGQRGHRDGLFHPLPNLQPDVLRFNVRTLRTDAVGGFVTVGTGTNLDEIAVYFNMTLEGMGVYEDDNGGHRVPYKAGRWYQIELRFSWTDRTVDFSVDGVLQRKAIPFRRQSVSSLSRIDLYNFDATQSWWDGIELVHDRQPNSLALTPTQAGPFVNGRWDGVVTLDAAARGVTLIAQDAAGHAGVSAPFDVLADNQLVVWQSQTPEPPSLRAPITNTVHIVNPGPLTATGVMITNRTPAGVNASNVQISTGGCTASAGQIVCGPLTLASNAHVTMTASFAPTNYLPLTNLVTVFQPPGTGGTNRIYNADAIFAPVPPVLTAQNVTVTEGNAGRTDAVFDLILSAPQPLPVTVQFATSNLTASVGSDFTPADGFVVIPPGVTRQTITVPVIGETVREPDEVFTLHLRLAENAILERGFAYGFILDDDNNTVATLPFFEDWERGLRNFWTRSGSGTFRATLSRSNEPFSGSFHLVMDNPIDDGLPVRSEFALTVDLLGAVNPVLRFMARGSDFDAPDGPPPAPFVGAADFDGVAVSEDGVHWYEAIGLRTLNPLYQEFSVRLDDVIARYGLKYTSEFKIRFSRVCGYAFPSSGMALDDISITSDPNPLRAGSFDLISEGCGTPNSVVDPGETVTAMFWVTNRGPRSFGPLTATLMADAAITPVSGPQSYTGLAPGGAGVGRSFTFVANGLCGDLINAVVELKESGIVVGRLPFEVFLGKSYTNHYSFPPVGPITITTNGPASPYPAAFGVAGTVGQVDRVVVTLHDLQHPAPDHLDILLRGPGGQMVTLRSAAGGEWPVEGLTLTFDPSSTNRLPETDPLTSGTYAPSNFDGSDTYPAPLPGPPYGISLDDFSGSTANGDWELYVFDDTELADGVLGSWSLRVDTRVLSCCGNAAAADLNVTIAATTTTTLIDGTLRYAASVRNLGPSTANGVVFTNAIPRGTTFLAATSSVAACSWDGAVVRCSLGALDANEAADITIDVRPVVTGPLFCSAAVTSSTRDSNPTNNVAAAITTALGPQLTVQAITGTESSNSPTFTRFELNLSPMTRTAMVYFATVGQTAVAGTDFLPTNGLVIFRPGETNKSINVPILNDLLDEPAEDLFLTLFNPVNLTLGASRVGGLINDDDNAPLLSVQNTSVTEGNSGLTPTLFRLQLSAVSAQAVIANFTTVNGTATAGVDYLATNGSFTLLPGETNLVLPVLVRGDRLNEQNETFSLSLTAPVNVTFANPLTVSTIFNDDLLPTFAITADAILAESCLATNGVVDPGERVTLRLGFRNISTGTAQATNVVATLLSTETVVAPSSSQTLGSFAPGAQRSAEFTLTAGTLCGDILNLVFALHDGGLDLDPVVVPIQIGRPIVAFTEAFDAVVAPAVPTNWTVRLVGAGVAWQTTSDSSHSNPNSITAPNPAGESTNDLISPRLIVHSPVAQLFFRHSFNTESNWDGGTLAISINDGPFVDFEEAGGAYLTGGYNGLVNDLWLGWTGNSGGYVPVVADLPPEVANQPFRLRWQFTSDANTGGVGWWIDSIAVSDGFDCCENAPPLVTRFGESGPAVVLEWTSVPQRRYQVQTKAALSDPSWSNLGSPITAAGGLSSTTNTLSRLGNRFYRIELLP